MLNRTNSIKRINRRSKRAQPLPQPMVGSGKIVTADKIFKLISYNVTACKGRDEILFPERVLRVLKKENPDILLLQETTLQPGDSTRHQARFLAKKLNMFSRIGQQQQIGNENVFNATLSKYPIEEGNRSPYMKSGTNKQELHSKIQLTYQSKLYVCNFHVKKDDLKECPSLETHRLMDRITGRSILYAGYAPKGQLKQFLARKGRSLRQILNRTGLQRITTQRKAANQKVEVLLANDRIQVHNVYKLNTPLSRFAAKHLPTVLQFSIEPKLIPAGIA